MPITVHSTSSGSYLVQPVLLKASTGVRYAIFRDTSGVSYLYKIDGETVSQLHVFSGTEIDKGITADIDSNNKIHVLACYYDGSNYGVFYRVYDTATESWDAAWEEAVATGRDMSWYTVALALDSNGDPHILYENADNILYGYKSGGSWTTGEDTTEDAYSSSNMRMFVESDGTVHCYDPRIGSMTHACEWLRRTAPNSWLSTTSFNDFLDISSFYMESDGTLHFLGLQNSGTYITYQKNGVESQTSLFDSYDSVSGDKCNGDIITSGDYRRILYHDPNGDLSIAYEMTAGEWIFETVVDIPSSDINADFLPVWERQIGDYALDDSIGYLYYDAYNDEFAYGLFEPQQTISESISVTSIIVGVGVPTWVSPSSGETVGEEPELIFQIPWGQSAMHFNLQLDTVSGFSSESLRNYETNENQTPWEYYDGAQWQPFPPSGVPTTYIGNNARLIVPSGLSSTTWYRRVRAGLH